MVRVWFPRNTMLPLVAALALAAATAQPEKPHILLITTDQQRVDSVGAYGLPGPPNVSPRLDALRAEGVLWTRAYAAAPSTLRPSRSSRLSDAARSRRPSAPDRGASSAASMDASMAS